MSTIKPEELVEIIRGVYGSNPATWPHTLPTFAAALEAELRKRWFAEPSAWLVADGKTFVNKPFSHEAQADMSIKERNDGARKLPLYTAPHEQEPT